MLTNPDDLKKDILAGHYDDHRDKVFGWFKARRTAVEQADVADIKSELQVGFHMVLKDLGGKAKALNGQVVTVKEIKKTKATVTFDNPGLAAMVSGGKFGERRVTVPLHCLDWYRK